ncbi:AMP-binding protein [Streptomyces sp. RPA4-5]|uniref:AMP-binding protein n=1 Tax=Streptomyces sp. RPA4-5 TaxID=2721245 RepID=UPI002001E22D|nr:AMP-binding protein [Streptomyces sp. RPA4-5]
MPQKTLYDWFAASVEMVPDEPALVVDGACLTYAELDAASREAARHLRRRGNRPPRVGLLASRRVATYAAYLATLRLGGTVVPLNATNPVERNRLIAETAGLDLVVTDGLQDTRFAEECGLPVVPLGDHLPGTPTAPADAPADDPAAGPDDVAYVLFTSGSTGRPKGVPIRHRNADAFLRHNIARYDVGPGCRLSQTFDLTFDPSVFDMFVAWGAGATLVVPSQGALLEPVRFVNEQRITHWYSVPALAALAGRTGSLAAGAMPGLRWSLFAGEQLTLAQAEDWARAAPGSTVENLYGPTELTVTVSAFRLPPERADWPTTSNGTVPIGQIYPHLEHRISSEGELLVRGPQRFSGYLDPADDRGRFVHPGPAQEPPGEEAWYRTGDRVGQEGGELVHLGRLDNQVKVLGQRVELEEIESALLAHTDFTEVVVVAAPGPSGDLQLAAVYAGPPTSGVELHSRLSGRLPAHMIPKYTVHRKQLPLNVSGKVDRQACKELAVGHRAAQETDQAVERSTAESAPDAALLAIVRQCLAVPDFGMDSNFYAYGGDSLIAVRVVNRARALGIAMTLPDLLIHQTVRGVINSPTVAGALTTPEADGPAEVASSPPFSLLDAADRALLPEGLADALPASTLQVGMVYLCELSQDAFLYHVMDGWEVCARFDEAVFRAALAKLVDRHPALRTSFAFDGLSTPLQLVQEQAELPLSIDRCESAEEADALVHDWCDNRIDMPINWRSPSLARCHVVARPESFRIVLAAHHAILDGWSFSRLAVELMTFYSIGLGVPDAEPSPVPSAVQHDFIVAEHQALDSEAAERHWLDQADVAPLLFDGAGHLSGAQERHDFDVDAALVAGLSGVARMLGVSVKSLALAAHAQALGAWSGRDRDIVTGVVYNTRPESAGSDVATGLFLNTLPMRFARLDTTWAGLARVAADAEREGAQHRAYPQGKIVERLGRPAFDVSFNFMNFHAYQELDRLAAVPTRDWWRRGKPSFPFHVSLEIGGDRSQVRIGFDPAAVPRDSVEAYAVALRRGLEALVARPSSPATVAVPAGRGI